MNTHDNMMRTKPLMIQKGPDVAGILENNKDTKIDKI